MNKNTHFQRNGMTYGIVGLAVAAAGIAFLAFGHFEAAHLSARAGLWLATISGLLFGANTVTYEWPITGLVAPTAAVMRAHSRLSATVLTDGATTTAVITHNMNISAADITGGMPEFVIEPISAAVPTADPHVLAGGKTTNAITVTVTANIATFRVVVHRPWSATK